MASNNPYAKRTPANPYASTSSSSSTTPLAGPYYPGQYQPLPAAASVYPQQPLAYPAYPTQPSYPSELAPIAGPSIPGGGVGVGYDMEQLQQASIYTPEASKSTRNGVVAAGQKGKARTTVLRKGGGEVWEDSSLLEWDPGSSLCFLLISTTTNGLTPPVVTAHFRLFIGDLDPAIGDEAFCNAFSGVRYPSFVKGRVIRDKYTNKGKGYGFVSYSDPEDFLKAWKEMNGSSPLFHFPPSYPLPELTITLSCRQVRRYPTCDDQKSPSRRQSRLDRCPQSPRTRVEAPPKVRNDALRASERRRGGSQSRRWREGLRTAEESEAVHSSLSGVDGGVRRWRRRRVSCVFFFLFPS
jgi:hypothetical protein